jgi:DUF1680 family protein
MLPTWMYATAPRGLWVNLFAGSTVTVTNVAGTSVRLVQTTDYPWNGKVTLALDPAVPRTFTLHLRVPNRQTSALYTGEPAVQGLISLALNGAPVPVRLERGYAVISRRWQAGDRLEFEIPLPVQRVRASSQVAADAGRVALRVGPLVYNFESVDQNLDAVLSPASPLATEWQGDLLGGVMVVKGRFADGSPLLAVPNYARLNRGGRSVVWIRGEGNRP